MSSSLIDSFIRSRISSKPRSMARNAAMMEPPLVPANRLQRCSTPSASRICGKDTSIGENMNRLQRCSTPSASKICGKDTSIGENMNRLQRCSTPSASRICVANDTSMVKT